MEQLSDSKPLEGIKILEYGVFHAGPGGVAILGDLGAEIIKIETGAGDPMRYRTHVADLDFSLENDFVVPFQHPMLGQVNIPGYPVQFSACNAGTSSAAPQLGEHTDEVLQYLGYSVQDIEQLRKDEVVK